MKNRLIIALTLVAIISFSTTHISAYTSKTSQQMTQNKQLSKSSSTKTIHGKRQVKKPEYYRPGHSDGLQNYPGKTIDAGMNTGMLPTNSASHSGNDISF